MVSVVMPAYNVEKYIAEAIDSVVAQSYKAWELIVIDDCSIDNTRAIVESYVEKYENIRLIKREVNSGNPRIPRCDGILVAKGEFVCPIDSDDIIEVDYLQKCVLRQEVTGADVVSNRLVFCEENGKIRNYAIPKSSFNLYEVIDGREAVKLTVGGWQISVNGLLIKKSFCEKYLNVKQFSEAVDCAFIDEMDYREILFASNIVAFSDAVYYYRQQSDSVVHDCSPKYFNVLKKERILYDFVLENYKDDKAVNLSVCNSYLSQLLICQRLFLERKNRYTKQEQTIVGDKIKEAFLYAKRQKMIAQGLKQKISMLSYPVFELISYLYVFVLKLKNR